MQVIQFVHEGLGNSSYLVQLSGTAAVLVDPDRSIGRYLIEAEQRGVRIVGVFETHLHADFVTGSRELLSQTGVEPYASKAGGVRFPHRPVEPGDTVSVEGVRVRVVGSAGHTPEHVSYVFEPPRDEPPLLFSGGSLIVGGAARTDLISPTQTDELTRAQYRTLKSAFVDLPDETLLYPTHGGGSFCSAGAGGERTSTLGHERASNPVLGFDDEDEFARWFPTTFPGAPDYFFKMRPINQAGPTLRSQIADPPGMAAEEFHGKIAHAVVIDTRPIGEYMNAHVPGAISIELRPAYSTWLGWVVPLGSPLLFVARDGQIEELLNESLLVGHENFAGYLRGGMVAWERSGFPVSRTRTLAQVDAKRLLRDGAFALDVREPTEFIAGHIPGAVNIPVGSIQASSEMLPHDRPVVAYCGHGERAATAVSLLERQGIDAANIEGGFEAWEGASTSG